jgi:hypothetical protein
MFKTYILYHGKSSMTYRRYGRMHRFNGPAVIFDDGIQYWYQYGKMDVTR